MKQQNIIENKIREIGNGIGADKIFVLTDSNVAGLLPDFLPEAPRLIMEAGEGSKSVEGVSKVWRFLVEGGALRRSLLVNVGGGMISDLGGFAAATFKRGISCINVPTTLLAAVDAAIGGKTGINFAGLKNEVGAFSLPLAVLPFTSLFSGLPEDEWLSGVGEVLKTGLLDSESLFALASSESFIVKREPKIVEEVVERCAAFKQKIVEKDFKEGGLRKILNLGHTAGHGIEAVKMAQGNPVPHGVAVAYGIEEALKRSKEHLGCDDTLLKGYREILRKYFPPLEMTDADWEEAERYMAHDKKNTKAGEPAWVLLRGIGKPVV